MEDSFNETRLNLIGKKIMDEIERLPCPVHGKLPLDFQLTLPTFEFDAASACCSTHEMFISKEIDRIKGIAENDQFYSKQDS